MAPLSQFIPVLLALAAAVTAFDRSTPLDGCLTVSTDGQGEYGYGPYNSTHVDLINIC